MKPDIYWMPGPWPGRLAILSRPRGGDWLVDEVEGWREADVQVVVSLLAEDEAGELGLADEAALVASAALKFVSFPIHDYDVPASEHALRGLLDQLEQLLNNGQNVGIHCRAGIGRSSLVVACLLIDSGENSEASFQRISVARGVVVPDTLAQRKWVGEFASHSARR